MHSGYNSLVNRVASLKCIVFLSVSLCCCATVPKEVVELSYLVGSDLNTLHASYDRLIHTRYEALRKIRMDYLNDEWVPHFVKDWIAEGELVRTAKGELVWDDATNDYVEVSDPQRATPESISNQLSTIVAWADTAIYYIEQKRSELIGPLDEEEQALRSEVREAFARVSHANAHITAHLNSLRGVQEVHDDILKALDLGSFRDSINQMLVSASQRASDGIAEIRKADGLVDQAAAVLRVGQ